MKRGVKNIAELSDDAAESIESHLDAMVTFAKAKEEKNPSA